MNGFSMTDGTDVQTNLPAHRDGTLSLMDLMIVLARRKRLLIGTTLSASVLIAAVSLALPDVYKTSTRILPPQQAQSGASALLAQLGGLAGIGGAGGGKGTSDLYVSMLKSRSIADRLIARFDLKKEYGTDSQEKARGILEKNTLVASAKDGLITIEVEGEDRKKVAKIANAYIDELTTLSRGLALTEAAQRRLFFQQQLELTKNNLAKAEAALKSGIDTKGVISVDADTRAVVETLSRLRAQASAKEIELSSMRAFVTTTNPTYIRVLEELRSLRQELSRLENGSGIVTDPTVKGASSGLENIRILREVKYHEMLYEMLAKQYEAARIDEAKDATLIQVLDEALEPERKSKPNRLLLVLGAAFVSFFATALWILGIEAIRRARNLPTRAAQLDELHSQLKLRNK